VDILGFAAPEWFFSSWVSTSLTKILVLFIFRIVILLTHSAHTHLLYIEVNFYFSIGIRAWYTLRRLNSWVLLFLTSIISDLSMDKVASIFHAMSIHRTMFIKPSMSHNHTQDKGASHSIPTCHHCGVNGHIHPNCFHIHSQKPLNKSHAVTPHFYKKRKWKFSNFHETLLTYQR
jgi:hypothetical protein